MFTRQNKTTSLVMAVIVHLSTPAPAAADAEQSSKASEENLQLVIRNMTADFHAFGIHGQQARMLAEQTADFGTLGIMTTIAAIGITRPVVNMVATRTIRCLRGA